MQMNIQNFTKPLSPNEVEWKIQAKTKDGNRTIIVPYIDARACYSRLDESFGAFGWKVKYDQLSQGFIATLSIKDENGEWVCKDDGASMTGIEPFKGGISDSLKRACHAWGLGRELYSYPRVMIDGPVNFIDESTLERLEKLTKAYNDGELKRKVYIL